MLNPITGSSPLSTVPNSTQASNALTEGDGGPSHSVPQVTANTSLSSSPIPGNSTMSVILRDAGSPLLEMQAHEVVSNIMEYLPLKDQAILAQASRTMKVDHLLKMQTLEQREAAINLTRNSITAMANSDKWNDEEFRFGVTKLINDHIHVGVNLKDIKSPERRAIVLKCLAQATHLRAVDLNAQRMPSEFAGVMVAIETMSKNSSLLRLSLDLSGNNIGDVGAAALAKNTTITHLDLRGNYLRDAGAAALAQNTTITHLDLSGNRIGDAGAAALAQNTTITHLDLSRNSIGDVEAATLTQ
ncbi:MAG: hypothetical protein ACXWIN_09260, partial [Burkholderiaceae bacterium]